jgi:hypothetical protein
MRGLWNRTRPRVEVLEDRTLLNGTSILGERPELPTLVHQVSALHATPPADDQGARQSERADSGATTKESADQIAHASTTQARSNSWTESDQGERAALPGSASPSPSAADDGAGWPSAAAAPGTPRQPGGDDATTTGQSDDGSKSSSGSTQPPPTSSWGNTSNGHDDGSGTGHPGASGSSSNQSDDGKSTAGQTGTGTGNSKDDQSEHRTPPAASNPKAGPPSAVGVAPSNNAAVAAETVHSVPTSRIPSSNEAEIALATSALRTDNASPIKESETTGTSRLDAQSNTTMTPIASDGNTPAGQTVVASGAENPLESTEIEIAQPTWNPQAADLIVPLPPLDVAKVQEAIQSFLRKLDNLGSAMISSPEGMVLSFWVLCAVSMAAGCEIARRRMLHDRQGLVEFTTEDPLFTWFPEKHKARVESGK